MRKPSKEKFIAKAKKIHGDKYDYSKVEYVNSSTKVCIICPKHGEFWQRPSEHVRGSGCPKCNGGIKFSKEDFVNKAKEVHGDKYDYSKVEYINNRTKVCIICPKHGEFWQLPMYHLNGNGCQMCCNRNTSYNVKEWVEMARKVHGDKYDYSKVEYVNAHTEVCIICPVHGEFWQKPMYHLNGNGCMKCGIKSRSRNFAMEKDEFIKRAREIHGNKYDYSKVEYINNHTKVCIICPVHGEFWQRPTNHLYYQGCPHCKESFLEEKVRSWLEKNNICYEYQKSFKWLKFKKAMKLDFYLPKYNIAIECQGLQHYKPVDFANKGKEWALENFQKNKERDKIKKTLCENNGVKLIYFNYNDKIIVLKNNIL